tara:strand:- start:728 stop:1183 length:456 start_codon:yes stop_codon:yes gene_type:complete
MKKSQLKSIIKECIREVLLEENGVMSHLIAEVAKGLTSPMLMREAAMPPPTVSPNRPTSGDVLPAHNGAERQTMSEDLARARRKSLVEAVGADVYDGIFEGVAPISKAGVEGEAGMASSPLSDVAPNDPGVDISGIMDVGNARNWSKLANG